MGARQLHDGSSRQHRWSRRLQRRGRIRRARAPGRHPLTSSRVRVSTWGMFVIELIYEAELPVIDANMRAHMAWLNKQYAAGRFLLSGRQIPRTGGIILALGDSREQIEALVRED